MNRPGTPAPILRRIALLAMLLPFVLLSGLPSGFMPNRTGPDNTLTLVLCTADGPQEMTLDLGAPDSGHQAEGCPWALAHAAIVLADAGPVPAPPVTLTAAARPAAPVHLLPAPLGGPLSARAPPILA